MRVAIIGSKSFDSLEYHLQDTLTCQGYNAKIFDFLNALPAKLDFGLTKLSAKYEKWKNTSLLERVIQYKPDLVIGVYRNIHPLVVREIKVQKIKIIHINPDALTTFQNQQLFVEPYDAYFTKDPYMKGFMEKKLDFNVFLYQEAFNPRVHKKPEGDFMAIENEVGIDVLNFGNLYPYRNRMLKVLKENDIDITLYGFKARYFDESLNENFQNRGIFGEEKSRILNGSKIVFNNFHYAEIESVNNKFFEITGSGAFQICDYKPILNDLLPIDPKLVSFETIDEAIEMIKYYLKNPEERWELRDKLTKYFNENYTYENMINNIFRKIV
ncbi:MAG: glycosyltransferase [Balneolaceae bacterium]|nr:glycosyltransferase [Balneolaceae bacterium]